VIASHEATITSAVRYSEDEAAFTRTGRNGVHRVEANGFIAGGFRHRTSRDRDPLLHTHVLVASSVQKKGSGKREPWNGQDWYVSFGEDFGSRSWDDACKYGFVSAGGGAWYSRTLRSLPIGARVFACIPGSGLGYVGVGTVIGEAMCFDDAILTVDHVDTKMTDLSLIGTYFSWLR